MPTSQECTTNEIQIKKNRVQLSHVLIDVDFFDKPKIIALGEKLGQPAIHLLIRVYAAMSKATDAEIDVSCIEYLARIIGFKDLANFLTYCVERGILCEGSQPYMLTNIRVIEDQEKLAKNREESRLRQEKLRDKRVTNALPTRLPDTDTVTDTVLDPLVEGGAGETTGAAVPSALKTPEVEQAITRWRAHLRKNHKRNFDPIAEEALYASYATRREELIRNIEWSVQNGWKTINVAPVDSKKTDPPKSMQRKNLENLQKVLKGENPWENDPIFGASLCQVK